MTPTLADNILIILYFLVWVLTLCFYQWKNRQIDAGSAIIASYVCYALFSILTLNQPITFLDYFEYNHLTLFPFIYLFLMLLIALSPSIVYHISPAKQMEDPNTRVLYVVAIIVIFAALALLPNILMNLEDGVFKLITDTDAGKDAYEEQLEDAEDAGGGISNLAAIIFNAISDISIFLCFYFLTLKKKNIWLIAGLCICILVAVLQPIMAGQRGPVIYTILTVVLGYMFFKQFLSKTIKKVARYIGIFVVVMTLLPIVAITLSRFSNMRQSTITDYINWYLGQGNIYFNNYALDDNGIRYGDRTFNLVKRVISSDTPQNFMERRAKYSNLHINDDLFTTFVGDFAIDFGPFVAFLLFVLFNAWVLYATRVKEKTLKVHQALLLYFTMCVCMQGGMTLFSFSDTGNLKMICFALLYVYLVVHEKILEKFPQQIMIVKESGKSLPKRKIIVKK